MDNQLEVIALEGKRYEAFVNANVSIEQLNDAFQSYLDVGCLIKVGVPQNETDLMWFVETADGHEKVFYSKVTAAAFLDGITTAHRFFKELGLFDK